MLPTWPCVVGMLHCFSCALLLLCKGFVEGFFLVPAGESTALAAAGCSLLVDACQLTSIAAGQVSDEVSKKHGTTYSLAEVHYLRTLVCVHHSACHLFAC